MRTWHRGSAVLAAAAGAVAALAVAGSGTATGLGAGSAAVGLHAAAPNHKISHSQSSNWSGYAVTGGTYTTATASWVQPTVTCSSTSYSSFWVGIDGDTSNTVEQTGTDSDCFGSTPVYYAWYEMYPKFPTLLREPVAPGDHLTSTVVTDGKGRFTLTLADSTQGWSKTVKKHLKNAALASAEVIAEAPSSTSGVLPLADFGTVGFSGAKVNGSTLTSSTPGIDPITMASGSTIKAQPSGISNGAFSVAWKHS